jgi:hypothetical protein
MALPKLEVVEAPPRVELTAVGSAANITILPVTVNLTLLMGDSFSFTVTVTNPDGSAANLVGATILADIRVKATDPNPAPASFTSAIAANVITLSLTPAVTAALPASTVWDCQMTETTGKITTLCGGTLTLTQDVSR